MLFVVCIFKKSVFSVVSKILYDLWKIFSERIIAHNKPYNNFLIALTCIYFARYLILDFGKSIKGAVIKYILV